MAWKKQGIELPEGLHRAVAERAQQLRGDQRGLGKYVWAVLALVALEVDDDTLRAAATRLRDEFERRSEAFTKAIDSGDWPALVDLLAGDQKKAAAKSAATLRDLGQKTQRKRASTRPRTQSG